MQEKVSNITHFFFKTHFLFIYIANVIICDNKTNVMAKNADTIAIVKHILVTVYVATHIIKDIIAIINITIAVHKVALVGW